MNGLPPYWRSIITSRAMETPNICDFRFAVFCENTKNSFNTEPFHMCYYHGVETDLVNLTTYLGYELWKVSTTCGIFLESVRATGVIFFLGVGSLVCYKLYGYYQKKRQLRKSTDEKHFLRRRPTISRWVSKELIDSCLNREPELNEIKKEYFGPADNSDDEPCSSCSEHGAPYENKPKKLVKEDCQVGREEKMGPSHSSGIGNKVVVYSANTGVKVLDTLTSIKPQQARNAPHGNSGHSHLSHLDTYNLENSLDILSCQKPRCLPLTRRKRKKHKSSRKPDEGDHIFTISTSSRESRKSVESVEFCDTDDECSSRLDSDEEILNGDGDDEDDEEGGDVGRRKQSESLVGNYSFHSLWERHQEIEPLESSGDQPRSLPVFVMSSSRSVSLSEDECQSEVENHDDPISFSADLSPISGLITSSRRSLCRDNSFGTVSEVSEISVDVTGFNNVGKQTEVRIGEIQKEIDDLKRDCIDMESHFGNMNAHGPTPAIYTELVKPCLSDISEGSDCSGEDKLVDDSSLRRSIFKPRLTKTDSGGSPESSFDQPSANSTSVSSRSANLSLEWDSMRCGEANVSVVSKKLPATAKVTNNCGDSGSDFGTPLTNSSPEPGSVTTKSGFEKAGSLEWDEEFSEQSKSDAYVHRSASNKPTPTEENNNGKKIGHPSMSLGLRSHPARTMWSSMESGYIDEFTESGVSCLVTPLTEDKSEKCSKIKTCEREKQSQNIRTWPVVGEKMSTKHLCSLFQANTDFTKICRHLKIKHFRPMHVDKTSALRAVVLQMLTQGFSPLEQSGGIDNVKKTFSKWARCNYRWLSTWGCSSSKKPCNEDSNFRNMLDSLQSLDWLTGVILSSSNSESVAVKTLNSDPEVDHQMVESAKLLMLKAAIELYEDISADKAVPIFVLRMFSRETSPETFMRNHLVHLGCCHDMQTMDLFLLGHSLGITICIISPDEENGDDVMKYYPDCKLGLWPEIYLARSEKTGQFCTTSR